jgi:DNA-binding response OmpR family regulator
LRLLTIRCARKARGGRLRAQPGADVGAALPARRAGGSPDDKDGIGLLKELQGRYPALPVILLTAHGTIPDAVTATKSGAFAFLTKPVEKDQLLEQIEAALKVSGFAGVTEDWRAGIITRNPVMEERLSQALMAAGSDAPLLITGAPGTGKARLRTLSTRRRAARRATRPCLRDTTIESPGCLLGRRERTVPRQCPAARCTSTRYPTCRSNCRWP